MARLLGPVPVNKAERELLKQFGGQLSADWIVISNVTWALRNEKGFVLDGEADAVVLAPGLGMVVVEVKGSRKIWIGDDGRWYRMGERGEEILLDRAPPDQAMGNMHRIADIVAERGPWANFPGRYAWLVAYPNGEASHVPAMFDESTLATRRHMHDLVKRIRHALDMRGTEGRSKDFTKGVVDEIARILTNRPFAVKRVDTSTDVEDDSRKIEELTRQQFFALRGVFEFPRVAVTGPAGSGKTLLAAWRLEALLETGARAIYVCYNKRLAAALARRFPEQADAVKHIDKFFHDLCPIPPAARESKDMNEYFKEELPERIFDWAANLPAEKRYEAIIVDEGQDFSESQLYALNELLVPDSGRWVIFSDRNQDIFKAGSADEVGAEITFRLYDNCRNTVKVNRATNSYLDFDAWVPSMKGMPGGESPRIEYCKNSEVLASEAWKIAREWASESGIAILSPYTLEKSSMSNSRKGHGVELTTDLNRLGDKATAYFSTIRAFKGIEAPAIILIDAGIPSDNPQSPFRREDLYVACTRPTSRLAILTKNENAVSWLKGEAE